MTRLNGRQTERGAESSQTGTNGGKAYGDKHSQWKDKPKDRRHAGGDKPNQRLTEDALR